jgi:hypothetical protein
VYELFDQTDGCIQGAEAVYRFPVICDFDLGGWSTERLEADLRSQSGQEVFQMAEHNYEAHTFFTDLLLGEARKLERVLIGAVSRD